MTERHTAERNAEKHLEHLKWSENANAHKIAAITKAESVHYKDYALGERKRDGKDEHAFHVQSKF